MALPTTLKTPGVYIDEKNAFPNSVVGVETAVPAFIGYTEKAEFKGKSFLKTPVQIDSLMDYVRFFGRGPNTKYSFSPVSDPNITPDVTIDKQNYTIEAESKNKDFKLFDALKFFYQNGGGTCYIVSVGTFGGEDDTEISRTELEKGIALLEKETVPTMLVIPDAMSLVDSNCYGLQQTMLMHCGEQMNRVAILDLYEGYKNLDDSTDNPVKHFRDNVSSDFLSYGAAYYPWLHTSIIQLSEVGYQNLNDDGITELKKISSRFSLTLAQIQQELLNPCINRLSGVPAVDKAENKVKEFQKEVNKQESAIKKSNGKIKTEKGKIDTANNTLESTPDDETATKAIAEALEVIKLEETNIKESENKLKIAQNNLSVADADVDVAKAEKAKTDQKSVIVEANKTIAEFDGSESAGDREVAYQTLNDEKAKMAELKKALEALPSNLTPDTINSVLTNTIPNYKLAMNAILKKRNLMAPSSAMAGIFSLVDAQRGVWKAPANVAVSSVISPAVLIDYNQQQDLNAPILGKAICAIRPFIGLGTMVWGARTLDANSLDWRYINVRRTMIMMEQSIKFAAKAYVFEPNVKNTWVSVKGMISNFLTNLWKLGALAGSVPEDAFSVNVGLGTTMTAVDILEGKMIIEVKVAVSRPAEFIVITFEQQMQKS